MRVVSFNVNGLRAFARKCGLPFNDYARDVLRADILCLQEIKGSPGTLAGFHALADFYTFSTLPAAPGRHGVATLVRKGLFCGKATDIFRGRILRTDHGSFVLYNCYLPFLDPGRDDPKAVEQVAAVYDLLSSDAERSRTVICGDLNACYELSDHYLFAAEHERLLKTCPSADPPDPDAPPPPSGEGRIPKDSPGPWELPYYFLSADALKDFFFSVYQRLWLRRMSAAYCDTLRLHNKNKKMYTCWNTLLNNRAKNLGTRIDYVFCTSDIECTGAGVMQHVLGSDHCPVYADLDLAAAGNTLKNLASGKNNLLDFFRRE